MARVSAPRRIHTLLTLALVVSCGARTPVDAPEVDGGGASDAAVEDGSSGERECPPDCTIGHQCCVGSCDGPAVPMPNDCCACLPGEVNTITEGCSGDMCGG